MNFAILLLAGGITNRGAEHSMHLLAEDLNKLGHKVDVFEAGKTNNPHYNSIHLPLPATPKASKSPSLLGKILERLYLNERGLLILWFSLKAMPVLFRHSYDVLVPTDGFWQVLVCKLVKLFHPRTIIVTWGLAGIGWTDAHTLKLRPDLFVALTEAMADWAKKVNPSVPVATIPLQVDLNLFNQNVQPVSLPLKHPIVITVAALNAYKRIDLVIKAVAETDNLSLLVLGEGEAESKLRDLGEKLLGHRFFLTSVSYQELPRYYTAADVFTLASEPQEAFGRVLIEAAASGLPIVTTDDPARRSIVGVEGIFVDPTNTQVYAKALARSAKLPKRIPAHISRFDRVEVARAFLDKLQ